MAPLANRATTRSDPSLVVALEHVPAERAKHDARQRWVEQGFSLAPAGLDELLRAGRTRIDRTAALHELDGSSDRWLVGRLGLESAPQPVALVVREAAHRD